MNSEPGDKKETGKEEEDREPTLEVEKLKERLAQKDAQISDLESTLSEKKEELENYIDRIKHLQADFENYKKRVRKGEKEKRQRIEDGFILAVIPIYDNLKRAFRSFRHNNDKESFIEGVEKIFSQFDSFLASEEVEPIRAEGKRFDPTKHEALITVESDGEPNMVLEEFERGYQRDGRVLKPSRVKVSKHKKVPEKGKENGHKEKEPREEG